MRFAYNNLIDPINTPSSELEVSDEYSSQYPVTNLYHPHLSKIWKSAATINEFENGNSTNSPTLDGLPVQAPEGGTWSYNAGAGYWELVKTAAPGNSASVCLADNAATSDLHGFETGQTYTCSFTINHNCATPANAKIIMKEYHHLAWNDIFSLSATVTGDNTLTCTFGLNPSSIGIALYIYIDGAEAIGVRNRLKDVQIYKQKRITFDANNSITPTIAILSNLSLPGVTTTITLQANSVYNFSSPAYSTNLTSCGSHYYAYISSSAYRLWSIVFSYDIAFYKSIPIIWNILLAHCIQAGYFYLGSYIGFNTGTAINFPYDIIDLGNKEVSPTGQVFGTKTEVALDEYSLNFSWLTDTEKNSLKTMYNAVRRIKPFYSIIDESNITKLPPLYGTIEEIGFNHIHDYNWGGKMRIREHK